MAEQIPTLLEISRLLKVTGKALITTVKSGSYPLDDIESIAANKAYIAKKFPINYANIPDFERLLAFLGFKIEKKFVFRYKKDVLKERYVLAKGNKYDSACCDIYYIVKKIKKVPIDKKIQFTPDEILGKGGKK